MGWTHDQMRLNERLAAETKASRKKRAQETLATVEKNIGTSPNIRDATKKRAYNKNARSPKRGDAVTLRLQEPMLERLDAWIAKNDPNMTRQEAIRTILSQSL